MTRRLKAIKKHGRFIPCTICHRHNSVENFKGAYVCRRCLKPLLVGVMVGRFESMAVISEIYDSNKNKTPIPGEEQ